MDMRVSIVIYNCWCFVDNDQSAPYFRDLNWLNDHD